MSYDSVFSFLAPIGGLKLPKAVIDNIANIKEIRESIGIQQRDLAQLAGITAVYLSEIENGRKAFTIEAAKKLASALNKLFNSGEEDSPFSPEGLRAGHIASFYPEEVQETIKTLLIDIEEKQKELDYAMYHLKAFPQEPKKYEPATWQQVLKDNWALISANLKHLKEGDQRTIKAPAHKKLKTKKYG